jgi:1-phosphofructokinase
MNHATPIHIVTVTPNPAIDRTIEVDRLRPGHVHRVLSDQTHIGGKGNNVASLLSVPRNRGDTKIAATGFLGKENAALFEEHYKKHSTANHCVGVMGETRTNIKVIEAQSRQTTDLNASGFHVDEHDVKQLFTTLDQLAQDAAANSWIVLAGSLPTGCPTTFYRDAVALIKSHNCNVLLDTSSEALRLGIQSAPTVIKPNAAEASELAGINITDADSAKHAAQAIQQIANIRTIIISLGEQGALFFHNGIAFVATPPPLTPASTVGAGDAMVAGFIASQLLEHDLRTAAANATAFSAGKLMRIEMRLPPQAQIEAMATQVDVRELK